MQGRSWMAALTIGTKALALGLILGVGPNPVSRADDAKTAPAPPTTAKPAPGASKVKLDLAIAGLGPKGCDIEVAPAHQGCQFRPVSLHLGADKGGKEVILFEDVQTSSTDRYCMFAITIREPGQPVKTIHRGLRLVPPAEGPRQRPAPDLLSQLSLEDGPVQRDARTALIVPPLRPPSSRPRRVG